MRRLPSIALALVAAVALALAAPIPGDAALHPGDTAPDFRGTDLDGVSHHLLDYRGRVVVLFVLGST
jgi:hypothetical protein